MVIGTLPPTQTLLCRSTVNLFLLIFMSMSPTVLGPVHQVSHSDLSFLILDQNPCLRLSVRSPFSSLSPLVSPVPPRQVRCRDSVPLSFKQVLVYYNHDPHVPLDLLSQALPASSRSIRPYSIDLNEVLPLTSVLLKNSFSPCPTFTVEIMTISTNLL